MMSDIGTSAAGATIRQQSILVVESSPIHLVETANVLRASGYLVSQVSGFNDANRLLASDPPNLLITGVKLGAYNGLHLIVRAHAKHPEMASILTSDVADSVLEAEAAREHAIYLTRPWHPRDFLRVVTRSLEIDLTHAGHAGPTRPDDSARHLSRC